MSKTEQLHFRLDGNARERLREACKLTGLDEASALRACITAFINHVEKTGEIRLPLCITEKPSKHSQTPSFPSTDAPDSPRFVSAVNEDTASGVSVAPIATGKRITYPHTKHKK